MTWATHYLRAATEAEMLAALDAAGLISDDETGNRAPMQASHAHALDIIGAIPGKGGWHANMRIVGDLHAALAAVEIEEPGQPVRVWA